MQPTIALIVTLSPLEVGADQAPVILERARASLAECGLHVAYAGIVDTAQAARECAVSLPPVDAICVIAATWTEDYLVQDLLAALPAPVPVIAWGLPGLHTGSLCGTQQLCCVLKELGYAYRFVYGEVDNPAVIARVRAVVVASAAIRALKGGRVGRIGGRMAGMAEVAVDEMELRRLFGLRLVERGLGWLAEAADHADADEAARCWQSVCARAGQVNVPDAEGIAAMRYYLALQSFIHEEAVCALTVECYPALMGRVCLPFSLLAEEGVVGACEGDVNAAVAMRILADLSGTPVHNTDLLADDPDLNTIVFAHCGSGALCLAECRAAIALNSCRLMDVGVTPHFPGRPGRVTLLNLVGRAGTYRLGVLTGIAVPTEVVFPGNPVKVRLDVLVAAVLDDIADAGLGHHWMIAEGDHAAALSEFGRLLGVPVHYPGKRGE
jgi:L-fucose isomerase-like protein